MKTVKFLFVLGLLSLMILFSGCISPVSVNQDSGDNLVEVTAPTASPEPPAPTVELQEISSIEEEVDTGSSRLVTFDQLGVSLEVPLDLHVAKDPIVSYDDSGRLESYLFYIQNYGFPGGPPSGDFQIYGHLQYNLPPITWEELAENTLNSPDYAYATEIEVNGVRGFDTQFSGIRNRYVYLFLLEGQVLSLAVADPTEENKTLADQIVSTMLYDPAMFTNASGVKKIVEPDFHYEMYIPDDWDYSFEPTAGIRVSDLSASSADAELVIEETDGPHSNFHYKSGIFMNLVIQEGDSASMEPVMAEVIRSDQIMISGIEISDYVFVEPSTMEGEIRELRFFHDGLSYHLRFNYASDVDQDLISWIILNLELNQD